MWAYYRFGQSDRVSVEPIMARARFSDLMESISFHFLGRNSAVFNQLKLNFMLQKWTST